MPEAWSESAFPDPIEDSLMGACTHLPGPCGWFGSRFKIQQDESTAGSLKTRNATEPFSAWFDAFAGLCAAIRAKKQNTNGTSEATTCREKNFIGSSLFEIYLASDLSRHVIDLRIHVICGFDHLRVGFIGTLRQYHLHELGHHIHIGILEVSLLQSSESFGSAGVAQHRVPGAEGSLEKIGTHALQAAGIRKGRELDLPQLGRVLLSSKSGVHHAILCNCDRSCIGRNRNGGDDRIAIGRYNRSLIVKVELAGSWI